MKHCAYFIKCLLLVPALLLAVFWMASPGGLGLSGNHPLNTVNNNPDEFYLFATNSTYHCYFTYDPLAADEWLFHTGGPWNTNR
jgi:hypothetical protein